MSAMSSNFKVLRILILIFGSLDSIKNNEHIARWINLVYINLIDI